MKIENLVEHCCGFPVLIQIYFMGDMAITLIVEENKIERFIDNHCQGIILREFLVEHMPVNCFPEKSRPVD